MIDGLDRACCNGAAQVSGMHHWSQVGFRYVIHRLEVPPSTAADRATVTFAAGLDGLAVQQTVASCTPCLLKRGGHGCGVPGPGDDSRPVQCWRLQQGTTAQRSPAGLRAYSTPNVHQHHGSAAKCAGCSNQFIIFGVARKGALCELESDKTRAKDNPAVHTSSRIHRLLHRPPSGHDIGLHCPGCGSIWCLQLDGVTAGF